MPVPRSRRGTAYEDSPINPGVFFDIEADRVWRQFADPPLGADRYWFYLVDAPWSELGCRDWTALRQLIQDRLESIQ